MLKKLHEVLQPLHQIREEHYNEDKNLTVSEKLARIKKEADEAIRKYGLKFKKHYAAA